MTDIIQCESNFMVTKQSDILYNFSDPKRNIVYGERERSFGLVQIHLPDHPSVTHEEATDPQFAVRFLASNLAQGRGSMWSCYSMID